MCIYIYTVEQRVQDQTILYRQPLEEEMYNNGMCVPLVCLYLVLCMHMCVCICVCLCVCAYVCVSMCVYYLYVCVYLFIVYIYVCMYVCSVIYQSLHDFV